MSQGDQKKNTERPDTQDFKTLFLNDTPMMDTRAPLEFKKGAFPHTVSLPLMTDQERAKVGTSYKRDGQEEAIKLGHRLVGGDVKEERLQKWLAFAAENPNGYLYCFRGGLRSQITQQWLKDAGVAYPRITGGYKAMRRFLIDTLERITANQPLIIVAGGTGCAKTELLKQVKGNVDLEGIAHHRGSTFGKRVGGQPSQISFENTLAVEFLRHEDKTPNLPIVLEDESMLIGRCALPDYLRAKMSVSPLVIVEANMADRVEHSFDNYILDKLAEWQSVEGEEAGFIGFASDLRVSMSKVERRLGGVRHKAMTEMLETAITAHEKGDPSLHRDWIQPMLEEYYDPMYHWQLGKKQGEILIRGSFDEVRDFLNQRALPVN
jgi:tRNA 2-selenouridine synthase